MRTCYLLIIIFLARFSWANDGAFYVRGGALIPFNETSIELKKEVLKFYIHDHDWMKVNVHFEFFNPGETKKMIVGFVTPPAGGDVREYDQNHPAIKDFMAVVNGDSVKYQVKRMDKTTFAGKVTEDNANDFVYYFEVEFKKGKNVILHNYIYKGGSSVEAFRDFQYQVTTGKRWANKKIEDFELQVHLDNGIFWIPASLWKNKKQLKWNISGSGVIKNKVDTLYPGMDDYNLQIHYAHLNNGYVYFKETDFAPDMDIDIGERNWGAGWATNWCKKNSCKLNTDMTMYCKIKAFIPDEKYVEELSSDELKFLRNYFYALRGLVFKTPAVSAYYEQFFWYKPIEGLKQEDIKLTPKENAFIAFLLEVEKKKAK
jgi:hypothetical protein